MALKETILDRAQKFIQKGALDKAIIEYRAALDVDPRDFAIRLKIGDLYTKLNKKAEAVKEYTEVARANSQRGFYLKAIAVYKQVLKVDDTILDVHYKLAELYAKQRLLADAISEYSHIVNIFEKKGKTSEVMELLKKMSEVDPENVGVRLKLADLYQKLSFEKDALEQYFWIFDKLVSQGKSDKAEKIYLNLYSIYPSEPRVLVGLAGLYRQKGDEDQFVRFSKGLLQFYRKSEDAQEARRVCEEILAVRPDEPESLAHLKSVKAAEQDLIRKDEEEKMRVEAELLSRQEALLRERQEMELSAQREASERVREEAERKAVEEAEAKARAEEEELKKAEETPLIGFPLVEEETSAGKEEPLIAFPEHEIEISLEGFEDHIPIEHPSEDAADKETGAGVSIEAVSGAVSEGDETLVDIEIPGLDESELRFTPRVLVITEEAAFHAPAAADALIGAVSVEAPDALRPQVVEPAGQVEFVEVEIEKEEIEEAPAEPGVPSDHIEMEIHEPPYARVETPEVHVEAPEVQAEAPEVQAEEPLIFIDDLEFKEHTEPDKTPLSEFDIHFKDTAPAPPQIADEVKEEQEPVQMFPYVEEEVASEPEPTVAHEAHGLEESSVPEAQPHHLAPGLADEKTIVEPHEVGHIHEVEVLKETAVSAVEASDVTRDVEAAHVHFDEPVSEMPEAEEDLSAAFSELMEKMGEAHEPAAPVPVIPREALSAEPEAASGPEDMIVESEKTEVEAGRVKKDEYVDLSAELGMEEAIEDLTGSWEGAASRESFDEFKSGMGQQLNREDSETHFNLGIAYMEMELFNEAVNEFKVAMKDPRLEFDCYIRLGHCAMAQADPSDAIVYYLKGLKIEGAAEQERKGMMYELALAYEAAGENDEAAQIFRSIYAIDPEFREVREKARRLSTGVERVAEKEIQLIPLDDGLIEVELL